ncbi:MAG: arginase [Cytophagales bacterium]|nr:MAG: arginase [Cytophagales bacterium]TAF59755.1 MAG: arginase [Cytophagales bacterium]
MSKINFIEVRSELGAGTRGASLGVEALKVACLQRHFEFWNQYHAYVKAVQDSNGALFQKNNFKFAKYVSYIYSHLQHVSLALNQSLVIQKKFPIVLSADHSSAYGTIAGVKSAFPQKRLGVVWIDAHADLHSPFSTPSGNMHGMPLAMAMQASHKESAVNSPQEEEAHYWNAILDIGTHLPKMLPQDLVFVSLRSTEGHEDEYITRNNIRSISTDELRRKGVQNTLLAIQEHLKNCDMIYVSFDVDSIDPIFSRGTGTPEAGGLTPQEACALNKGLTMWDKTVAWEVAEINPLLDNENQMALYAADVLLEVVQAVEKRLETVHNLTANV